ncbi:MAG: OmpA family protein [Bacteroidaceae bacterium]|nr:OmpA family protein [Bacteroidaceae bacterium]
MKALKFICIALCAVLLTTGCGMSNTGKGALIGTGGGAALGAAVGAIFGGGTGAAIGAGVGAAVGAGAGALIGNRMDKAKKQAEAVQNAQVESTTDKNGLQAVKVTFDGGILFATGKTNLTSSAQASLSEFAANVLNQNKDMDVAIYGHTDNTGSDAVNNPLSSNRAGAVQSYLLGKGVAASQIKEVRGFGSTSPVADNSTEAGRQQNRRVEIYLYASQQMIQAAEAQQN